jgi:hypothetical protein
MRGVPVVVVCAQLATGVCVAQAPASPYEGTWSLRPQFTTTCSAGDVAVELVVGQVRTRQTAPDSITITSDAAVSGAGMIYMAVHTLTVALDPGAGAFRYAGPVRGSAERGGLAATLTGRLRVRARFLGADSLTAAVEATMSMKVNGASGTSSGSCTPVKMTIRARRVVE